MRPNMMLGIEGNGSVTGGILAGSMDLGNIIGATPTPLSEPSPMFSMGHFWGALLAQF